MEDLYFFWNTFNLLIITVLTLSIGLLIGAAISTIISVITQVNDPTISFITKFAGCILGAYILAPTILGNISSFAERIWSGGNAL